MQMNSDKTTQKDILIPDFTVPRGIGWLYRHRELLTGHAADLRLVHTDNFRLILKAEMDEAVAFEALQQHLALCDSGKLLKCFAKRRISRVHVGGRSFIVKEFRKIFKIFDILSPDRRTWLGINRLQGACPALVWIRSKCPYVGYILLEDGGVQDLMLRMDSPMLPIGTLLFHAAGRIIARLHRAGVFHADCKASNFVARQLPDGHYAVTVIDCDDVRVMSRVPASKIARNLAQFLGVNWDIEDFDLRKSMSEEFLAGFCSESGQSMEQLRSMHPSILSEIARLYPGQETIMSRILK